MAVSKASGSNVLWKADLKDKETVSMQVNWMNKEVIAPKIGQNKTSGCTEVRNIGYMNTSTFW